MEGKDFIGESSLSLFDALRRSKFLTVLMLVCVAAIIFVATTPFWFLPPLIILACVYVAWSFSRPVAAIVTIVFLYLHVVEQSEEITPLELVFGAYLFGYFLFWFGRRIIVDREPVLTSMPDKFLIVFLIIGLCSIVLNVTGGGSVLLWFREMLTISYLLLYFPAREVMRTAQGAKKVFVAFAVMSLIVALKDVYEYTQSAEAATYVWQLIRGRTPFGAHFFFPMVIGGAALFSRASERRQRVFSIVLTVVFSLALLLTFTRGFWIGTGLGLIALLFLSEGKPKSRLIFAAVVLTLGTGAILISFEGGSVLQALFLRLGSVGSALRDISVEERLAESRTVVRLIGENPLVGYGVGSEFTHYNILDKNSVKSLYVHNGYLYLLFKIGIVGTLAFLGFLWGAIITGIKASRRSSPGIAGAFQKASTAILFALSFVTLSSNAFRDKESVLVLILTSACVMGSARAENSRLFKTDADARKA